MTSQVDADGGKREAMAATKPNDPPVVSTTVAGEKRKLALVRAAWLLVGQRSDRVLLMLVLLGVLMLSSVLMLYRCHRLGGQGLSFTTILMKE